MNEMDIDFIEWAKPKPFGISGCFRLRNESQWMEKAILSHLPYLDEAVLVVQPSDDDTLEIANRLAEQHEKVNVYEYPLVPDWIDTPGFYAKDPDSPGHLVHLSNWALRKCRFSWICKVEGDVIALSTMQRIVERVKARPNEWRYYGRVIVNLAGENCDLFSQENPRNGGWDEAVFPNHPDFHFIRRSKWEVLDHDYPSECMGWSALHMKRCKAGKTGGWNGEHYLPYTPEIFRKAAAEYNRTHGGYPGDDDPLGAECIWEKEWLK